MSPVSYFRTSLLTLPGVKNRLPIAVVSGIALFLFSACSLPVSAAPEPVGLRPGWNRNLKVRDVAYDIYLPPNYSGNTLLVLPGWKFPKEDWIRKSSLLRFSEKYGYILIMPEMNTTLYASRYYPETKLKWNRIPGGEFMKSHFIPAMQSRHSLLKKGGGNFLLGLSTGGRGVARIALDNPGIFRAGAALSGDFAQEKMPHDRLMTALYGPFRTFQGRWTGEDNPAARSDEWNIPLYLAHGTNDTVVPEEQSRSFYEKLKSSGKSSLPVEYHAVKGAGHDYDFWNGRLPDVFAFFESFQ